MTKLQCKIKCVTCSNIISEWYIRDVPDIWRFFSKCTKCDITNLFFAPKHLNLKEVVTFVAVHNVASILSETELDRLDNVKIRYKVPNHIPIAQIERYKNKKREEHFARIDKIWGGKEEHG